MTSSSTDVYGDMVAEEEEVGSMGVQDADVEMPGSDRPSQEERAEVARHGYLDAGADVPDSSISLLDHGHECSLPFINLGSALIVPGATLPLYLMNVGELATVRSALLSSLPYRNLLCTTVKGAANEVAGCVMGCILQIMKLSVTGNNLRCIAEGRQRCMIGVASSGHGIPSYPRVVALQDEAVRRVPPDALRGASPWPSWIWQEHNAWMLADKAVRAMERVSPQTQAPSGDPSQISYWLVRQMPSDIKQRQRLLEERNVVLRLQRALQILGTLTAVRCASCQAEVADVLDSIGMTEDGPSGVFVNSGGYVHDLLCVLRARRCEEASEPTLEHTWFPAYTWACLLCACQAHLGWKFEATKPSQQPKAFYGLRRASITLSPQATRS